MNIITLITANCSYSTLRYYIRFNYFNGYCNFNVDMEPHEKYDIIGCDFF